MSDTAPAAKQFAELSDRLVELIEREWDVGFATWGYPTSRGTGRRLSRCFGSLPLQLCALSLL